jgi:hypothetical protein
MHENKRDIELMICVLSYCGAKLSVPCPNIGLSMGHCALETVDFAVRKPTQPSLVDAFHTTDSEVATRECVGVESISYRMGYGHHHG